jgi:hypothetical protein
MLALSVRQPYAWLLVHGIKDIENRTWATRYRGPLLIHASLYQPSEDEIRSIEREFGMLLPHVYDRGGIVGQVTLVECARASDSRWFEGPVGWRITNASALPFRACRGALYLFEPNDSAHIVRALATSGQVFPT